MRTIHLKVQLEPWWGRSFRGVQYELIAQHDRSDHMVRLEVLGATGGNNCSREREEHFVAKLNPLGP